MPNYRYVSISLNGEYFRGEFVARDKNELVRALWEHQLFLVWWREIPDPVAPEAAGSETTMRHFPVSRDEIMALWKDIIESDQSPIVPGKIHDRPKGAAAFDRSDPRHLAAAALAGIAALVVLQTPISGVWNEHKAAARFRQARADMQNIAAAAVAVRMSTNHYPLQVFPGTVPAELQSHISQWLQPPCPGWTYGWDNWQGVPGMDQTVRVTLRAPDLYAVYFLCLESTGNCSPENMWSHGTPIENVTAPKLTCAENQTVR